MCFPAGISYTRAELAHIFSMPNAVTLVGEVLESGEAARQQPHEIAGFAVADKEVSRGRLAGHLITIDVADAHRGRGAGSAILGAMEQRLMEQGVRGMRLEVAVDNERAQRFYRKLGYESCGWIAKYYLGSIDALLMEKPLAERQARTRTPAGRSIYDGV